MMYSNDLKGHSMMGGAGRVQKLESKRLRGRIHGEV